MQDSTLSATPSKSRRDHSANSKFLPMPLGNQSGIRRPKADQAVATATAGQNLSGDVSRSASGSLSPQTARSASKFCENIHVLKRSCEGCIFLHLSN